MQIKSCNAAKFSPGDFVQVVVKVIALVQPGKYNAPATVVVRFDLLSCIRLLSSKEAVKVSTILHPYCENSRTHAFSQMMPMDAPDAPAAVSSEKEDKFEDGIEDMVDDGPDML